MPNFDPFSDKAKILTSWVRIPGLSLEYFHGEFLKRVGGIIGKVIRVDATTLKADMGQFVRLGVEVDLAKPILSKFKFMGIIWLIQYEGIRMLYYHCAKVGHTQENCPSNPDKQAADEVLNSMVRHPAEALEGVGAWNKVVKVQRGQHASKNQQGQRGINKNKITPLVSEEGTISESRFVAFAVEKDAAQTIEANNPAGVEVGSTTMAVAFAE
ncbi:hypothetical protein V2J09_001379 [Rumex salicifolius]